MLEALGFEQNDEELQLEEATAQACAISQAALNGTEAPNTFRLVGQIQKCQVMMLVDSGSSHCFVSEEVAATLAGNQRARTPVKVKIADGGELICDKELVGCDWWCQGATFSSNFKVLPLGGYDVIIGMDWLQARNPMGLDWLGKRMAFWNSGKLVLLTGVRSKLDSCKEVDPQVLTSMLQQAMVANVVQVQALEEEGSASTELPPTIAQVLTEFEQVFAEP
jgi:hypothetical protein